jgi:hypothetical protein
MALEEWNIELQLMSWFTGTIAQSEPKLGARKYEIPILCHPVIIFGECEGEKETTTPTRTNQACAKGLRFEKERTSFP